VSQLSLVGRDVGRPKDPHGRFFTPAPLARVIVGELVRHLGGARLSLIVEPSIGDGLFVTPVRDAWPDATLVGVDIDPLARGIGEVDQPYVGDWCRFAAEWNDLLNGADVHHSIMRQQPDLIVGNPPFTKDSGRRNDKGEPIIEPVAHLHVEASLALRPTVCAFILPWAYAGGVERWNPILEEHPPAFIQPITPRPWGADMREVALYVWIEGVRETRRLPLPRWK
jgi:hypothetical protein